MIKEVFKLIKDKNLKIAFAESITGGLLASEFVKNKGASSSFELGIVAYSNKMKEQILNIDQEILNKYGAVSEVIAELMATNIKQIANADIGVGVTGNAGPTAQEKSDVGEVYISIIFLNDIKTVKLNIKNKERNELIDIVKNEVWRNLLPFLKD